MRPLTITRDVQLALAVWTAEVGRAKRARSKLQECQAQGGAWIQRTGECR